MTMAPVVLEVADWFFRGSTECPDPANMSTGGSELFAQNRRRSSTGGVYCVRPENAYAARRSISDMLILEVFFWRQD